MGIGHYTEQDVAEAARAFTGWTVDRQRALFDSSRHDNEPKEFLGVIGNHNDLRITNIIFEQPATAEFICRKLYQEFVYAHPDEAIAANSPKSCVTATTKSDLSSKHSFSAHTFSTQQPSALE